MNRDRVAAPYVTGVVTVACAARATSEDVLNRAGGPRLLLWLDTLLIFEEGLR